MAPDEAERLKADVLALRHVVFGNGKQGIAEAVRNLQTEVEVLRGDVAGQIKALRKDYDRDMTEIRRSMLAVDRLGVTVGDLSAEATAERNRREGEVRLLRNLRTVLVAALSILGIGGGVIAARLLDALAVLSPLLGGGP